MANEKLQKLTKYVDDLKAKLTSPPPSKRAHNPATYYEFLRREIQSHQAKVDEMKLSEPVKK